MKKKPTPKSIAVAMRWPDSINREVEAAAQKQGRSFSEFVRTAALQKAREQ